MLIHRESYRLNLFKSKNVDKIWNRVAPQVKVAYEIENFDYGMREFDCYDNNGYLIQSSLEKNRNNGNIYLT